MNCNQNITKLQERQQAIMLKEDKYLVLQLWNNTILNNLKESCLIISDTWKMQINKINLMYYELFKTLKIINN